MRMWRSRRRRKREARMLALFRWQEYIAAGLHREQDKTDD